MIKAVVKVGGSLSRGAHLPVICEQLGAVGLHSPLLVVPGGGPFADMVRDQARRFNLGDSTAHWMAIQAMDQYGRLLAELVPGSQAVHDLAAAGALAGSGRIPVLLPFELLYAADPLPHSWDVTSDSIAAWIAFRARVPLLILLKDVEGLYARLPEADPVPELCAEISQEQLACCDGVDSYLSQLLPRFGLELWVISGERPQRLADLLAKGRTTGTYWHPPGASVDARVPNRSGPLPDPPRRQRSESR
jgi:aspartokinase-like uncharacterized kinase